MISVILMTIATLGQFQPHSNHDAAVWMRVQQMDELARGTPRILPGMLPYPYRTIPNYIRPFEYYQPYQPYYRPYYYQPYRPYQFYYYRAI